MHRLVHVVGHFMGIAWGVAWCIAWCVPWCVTRLRRDEWQQVGAVEVVRRVTGPAGLVAPAVETTVVRDAHVHRVVEAHLRGCRGCVRGV